MFDILSYFLLIVILGITEPSDGADLSGTVEPHVTTAMSHNHSIRERERMAKAGQHGSF